jgi:hypothetical protein
MKLFRKGLIVLLFFLVSGCNVYYSEIKSKPELQETVVLNNEQVALLNSIINYLKNEKSFLGNEMIIDSLDLVDTIFIKTKDTTLCKKKYLYFNNILSPTNNIGSCDNSIYKGRCLDVSFVLLSEDEINFSYIKPSGTSYEGYLRVFYNNDKRIVCCLKYGIGTQ